MNNAQSYINLSFNLNCNNKWNTCVAVQVHLSSVGANYCLSSDLFLWVGDVLFA